jgi:hypothetical protein
LKGDFTRFTYRRRKHYSKVNMQQGRVQIDADWNEQADIENYYNRLVTSDIIGNHGVPMAEKDGFRIEPLGNSYLIRKGRYYVDGIVCESESDRVAFEQPDLPPVEGHRPCPVVVVQCQHIKQLST